MEDGENIIKGVLKTSGMVIPEFYELCRKAFSKVDSRENAKSKKEMSDFIAERRRINQYYRGALRKLVIPLNNYMELKNRIAVTDGDVLNDKKMMGKRESLLNDISRRRNTSGRNCAFVLNVTLMQ